RSKVEAPRWAAALGRADKPRGKGCRQGGERRTRESRNSFPAQSLDHEFGLLQDRDRFVGAQPNPPNPRELPDRFPRPDVVHLTGPAVEAAECPFVIQREPDGLDLFEVLATPDLGTSAR